MKPDAGKTFESQEWRTDSIPEDEKSLGHPRDLQPPSRSSVIPDTAARTLASFSNRQDVTEADLGAYPAAIAARVPFRWTRYSRAKRERFCCASKSVPHP